MKNKNFIKHYGIQGQKWGLRRWQNPDGSFNEEGKERYFGKSSNEYGRKAKYLDDALKGTRLKDAVKGLGAAGLTSLVLSMASIPLPVAAVTAITALSVTSTIGTDANKKVKDFLQKGNSISNDLIENYGDMTMNQAQDYFESKNKKEYEKITGRKISPNMDVPYEYGNYTRHNKVYKDGSFSVFDPTNGKVYKVKKNSDKYNKLFKEFDYDDSVIKELVESDNPDYQKYLAKMIR